MAGVHERNKHEEEEHDCRSAQGGFHYCCHSHKTDEVSQIISIETIQSALKEVIYSHLNLNENHQE